MARGNAGFRPFVPKTPNLRKRVVKQTVTVQPPTKIKTKTRKGDFFDTLLDDLYNAVSVLIRSKEFLLITIVAFLTFMLHDFNAKTGPIYNAFSGSSNKFSEFMVRNAQPVVAFLLFIPPIALSFSMSRSSGQTGGLRRFLPVFVTGLAVLWCAYVVEPQPWEYIIHSVMLSVIIVCRKPHTVILIALVGLVFYGFGWLTKPFDLKHSGENPDVARLQLHLDSLTERLRKTESQLTTAQQSLQAQQSQSSQSQPGQKQTG